MKYMGGKSRQATALVETIARIWPGDGNIIEPFMGGANMTAALGARYPDHTIIASDANPDVVLMWQALQAGWLPPTEVISRNEWAEWKARPGHSALRGWYGVAGSMNGCWFRSYGVEYDFKAKPGNTAGSRDQYHNYLEETARAAAKQIPGMAGALIFRRDYTQATPQPGDLVYCDPPYAGTAGYGEAFGSEAFWSRALDWARLGCYVFVSEYTAPDGWDPVFSLDKAVTARTKNGAAKYATDRLFYWVPG